jgi:hypothetical protein
MMAGEAIPVHEDAPHEDGGPFGHGPLPEPAILAGAAPDHVRGRQNPHRLQEDGLQVRKLAAQ